MRESSLTSLRVLVVDDNADTASILTMLLRMWGHDVCMAHDGPSAVEAARDFLPDAVILDVGLPLMDGFAVAARLRALPRFARTLIVGSSGYCRESDRQRATEVGMDHYFIKPFDPLRIGAILDSFRSTVQAVPA